MIKVNAIKCPYCRMIIYSRATHDYRRCVCGLYAIDGGFDYSKITFFKEPPPHIFTHLVNATEKKLYDDWNLAIDKYGMEIDPNDDQNEVIKTLIKEAERHRDEKDMFVKTLQQNVGQVLISIRLQEWSNLLKEKKKRK